MRKMIFPLLFILLLSACTQPAGKPDIKDITATLPEGISMTVDTETVTSEGASFLLLQTTEHDIRYGDDYFLQVLENEVWRDVPYAIDNWGFHSIAYNLPKNTPKTLEVNWKWLYGSLPAGEYRLVKEFMDFRGTGDYDKYTITAAFIID